MKSVLEHAAVILDKLYQLPAGQWVVLELTLPEQDDFFTGGMRHANVLPQSIGLQRIFLLVPDKEMSGC